MKKILFMMVLYTTISLVGMGSSKRTRITPILTIDDVLNNFNDGIENNNYAFANEWFQKFSILAGADYKAFTPSMKKAYGDKFYQLLSSLRQIEPQIQNHEETNELICEWAQSLLKEFQAGRVAINWKKVLGEHQESHILVRLLELNKTGKPNYY